MRRINSLSIQPIRTSRSFALRVLFVFCIIVWISKHDASAQSVDKYRGYVAFQPAWLLHGVGRGSGLHPTFIMTGEYQWAVPAWLFGISASAGAAYVQPNDTYTCRNICVYADLRIAVILDESVSTTPFIGVSFLKSPDVTLHLANDADLSTETWSDMAAWCVGVRYRADMWLCFDITLRRSIVESVHGASHDGKYGLLSFGWLWRVH